MLATTPCRIYSSDLIVFDGGVLAEYKYKARLFSEKSLLEEF